MRAWAKRMIWYVIFFVIELLSDLVYFMIHGIPRIYGDSIWISFLILVIPLIAMQDDKENKK